MSLVTELKDISNTIFDLSITYSVKKIEYKKQESKLMLETDFEEALGKKRPTVAEKEAYVPVYSYPGKRRNKYSSSLGKLEN